MMWIIIAVIAVILLAVLFFVLVRKALVLVINGVIGLFALIGFNLIFGANIKINFWSIIITAIGGIIGFGIVTALHYLKLAF